MNKCANDRLIVQETIQFNIDIQMISKNLAVWIDGAWAKTGIIYSGKDNEAAFFEDLLRDLEHEFFSKGKAKQNENVCPCFSLNNELWEAKLGWGNDSILALNKI